MTNRRKVLLGQPAISLQCGAGRREWIWSAEKSRTVLIECEQSKLKERADLVSNSDWTSI